MNSRRDGTIVTFDDANADHLAIVGDAGDDVLAAAGHIADMTSQLLVVFERAAGLKTADTHAHPAHLVFLAVSSFSTLIQSASRIKLLHLYLHLYCRGVIKPKP